MSRLEIFITGGHSVCSHRVEMSVEDLTDDIIAALEEDRPLRVASLTDVVVIPLHMIQFVRISPDAGGDTDA